MITFFSHLGKSWVAKIIFVALGISMMAFWGLGGLMNTSLSSNNTAIKVGSGSVSIQQLMQTFEGERQKMSAMMGGQYLSPEQAVQNGLLAKSIQGQIIALVQNQVQKELDLTASDKAVQKYVERNPAFLDALGNFDKNIFYAYLAQTRLSETQLAKELKNELAMQHLTNPIAGLGYNPDALADVFYRFKNEKRSVSGMLIEAQNIQINETPTQEELRDYYATFADKFILPEYRQISIVSITPADMLDKSTVDEAAIDAIYAEKKATFGTPEKREISQMRFDTKDKASAAMKGLTPATFDAVAKTAANQTPNQTNFGWVAKDELAGELSEPVFAATKGALVGPVNSSMGWHVLLVKDIKAGVRPNEGAIRNEIKKQLATEGAYSAMEEASKKLEDELGSGKTLDEAAKTIGFTVRTLGAVDLTGKKKDGTELPEALKNTAMLQNAFMLSNGETSSLIENSNGAGYTVVRVDDIIASTPKDFDVSKPELTQLWRAEQQQAKLQSTAAEILARVQKGANLGTLGTFGNFKIVAEKDVTRDRVAHLPAPVIPTAFTQKTGSANAVATPVKNGIFISVVDTIVAANPGNDKFGLNVVKENLKALTGETMANEVMAAYADSLGVKVNDKEIEQAFAAFVKQANE